MVGVSKILDLQRPRSFSLRQIFHQEVIEMYFPTLVLTLLAAVAVRGHPTGAPQEVCQSMTPGHEGATTQEATFPYDIVVEKKALKGGESTKLTIKGKDGETFKGFLIQARVGEEPVGTFSISDGGNAQLMDCGSGKQNAVTHTNADDKKEVTVDWKAPEDLKGEVVFHVTIVKLYDIFWVAEKSEPVTVS